jgi:uncharacterized protein YaaN involved in tellurite resistance
MSEPKKDYLDELLVDPFANTSSPSFSEEAVPKAKTTFEILTPEHREKARKVAEQIDYKNQQAILQYGVAAQSELSQFSHSVLNHIQKKDTGPVGEAISELMLKINQVNPEYFRLYPNRYMECFQNIKASMSKSIKSPISWKVLVKCLCAI